MPIAPEGFAEVVGDLASGAGALLLPGCPEGGLDAHHVPEEKQAGLFGALEEANAVPELAEPAHVMAKDMARYGGVRRAPDGRADVRRLNQC